MRQGAVASKAMTAEANESIAAALKIFIFYLLKQGEKKGLCF